ncbi:hypothetical protein [Thiomicrorhabdus indica]|uniref:hypothetical protein n=1 Tax=Thiomicrorhabdus indica TaxID=2267253 RepID=UPI00102DEEFD|nr:hypothetical protein [Thiomicrorhabdus indica]
MKIEEIDDELLNEFRQQVATQIIESLRLNFLGIDRIIGLEINFKKLQSKITKNISIFHPDMQLSIASELLAHEILEVKAFCYITKERWNPLREPIICFALRVEKFECFQSEKPVLTLVEVAEWINEKLCSKP